MTWILCEILEASAEKSSSGSVSYGTRYLDDLKFLAAGLKKKKGARRPLF
jgi:hypothetical protein